MIFDRAEKSAGALGARVGKRLLTALGIVAALALGTPVFSQESDAGACPSSRIFNSSAGGIQIKLERPASDAEVLAALEDAARQMRQRLAAAATKAALNDTAPPRVHCGLPVPVPPADAQAFVPSGPAGQESGVSTVLADCTGDHLKLFPNSLLWQPPMANQHEPQTYARPTSLSNDNSKNNFDAAIGGTAPLLRLSDDDHGHNGLQLDFFSVVFVRLSGYRELEDVDFSFGLPLTWANGPWQAKLGVQHLCSHLGDDFMLQHAGSRKRGHTRDEVVGGLAYRFWNQLRVYGQLGYALDLSTSGPHRGDRYDVGVEWSKQVNTGPWGQPFAAIDLDVRGDEDYTPDLSAQVGWQWQELGGLVYSLRVALEFYDGRSPFGQFFDQREKWVGLGLHLDF